MYLHTFCVIDHRLHLAVFWDEPDFIAGYFLQALKRCLLLINQRDSDEVVVHHYPIRSYEQFERNVRNRQPLLHKGARMGDHYRRWVRLFEQGKLEEEFSRFVMAEKDVEVLTRFGVIERDTLPRDTIQAALQARASGSNKAVGSKQ